MSGQCAITWACTVALTASKDTMVDTADTDITAAQHRPRIKQSQQTQH